MRIYTRKGDDGTTSLWYGGRIPKSHPRPEAFGALDEANAQLGRARAESAEPAVAADICRLQSHLFIAGAELATSPAAHGRLIPGQTMMTDEIVEWLESRIDHYMSQVDLPPKFVIPGGNALSAQLDIARATLRRAERRAVDLSHQENVSPTLLRFLNRANDFAFALARYCDVEDPELFHSGA